MAPSRGTVPDDFHLILQDRILSIPGVRTLLAFLALFSVCLLYGHTNFYRDPGSVFFDEDHAYVRWYSAFRQRQAEAFTDSVAQYTRHREDELHQPHFPKANANASMCAVFITTTKPGEDHRLEASVGSILEGLTPAERANLNLQVFFANIDPSHHSSWYKSWLRHLVDRVYTYADLYSFEGMADVLALEQAGQPTIGKPPVDYALALQQCHEHSTAPYITVLDDDIIAADGWFARTLVAARDVELKLWDEGRPGRWIYLRMFSEEGSIGWASDKIGGNNELPISLLVASVAYLLLLLVRRQLRATSTKVNVDKWTMFVICCVAIPSFVVLFFQAGRASMLPPATGVREEEYGCCGKALVFNREHVPNLVQYIHGSAYKGQRDLLTKEYSWHEGLGKFASYPVMIQHVGAGPPVQTEGTERSKAWSMAFESLNPRRLQRDHAKLVKLIYGVNAFD